MFLFCFVCFAFVFCFFQCLTKRKVKKWRINRFHEKKQKTTKKKKTENEKVALHDKVTLSQMGFLEATRTKLPCD